MTPGEQIDGVLGNLVVVSPTEFSWFGRRLGTLPEEARAAMTAEDARSYLAYTMQGHLYAEFYCQGSARATRDAGPTTDVMHRSPFVQALSNANAGSGSYEPGWTLVREEEGKLVVGRGGLTLWVAPNEVRTPDGRIPEPGRAVAVRMPKELLRLSPGFYMALGDAPLPIDGRETIVRLYWHLVSDGARAFVADCTSQLNGAGVPFRLKVVNQPERYTRCDAGVVYCLRRDYPSLQAIVRNVYRSAASTLRARIPALTKRLAPGLGVAEDPGNGDSFGMHRCRLLVEGILRAHDRAATALAERRAAVAERFGEEHLSLDHPHLGADSTDQYEPLTA